MYRACYIAVLALCLAIVVTSLPCAVQAQDQEYTPEQIKSTSAETFLARLGKAEPGYANFAALNALGRKAKEADPETRRLILNMVIPVMNDTSRTVNQRFRCCYVISRSGDERGVPFLIDILFKDSSTTMRSVAAEALADFAYSTAAHDALVQASKRETDAKVLEVINRRLSKSDAEYTPEQIKSTSAETFLARMGKAEPGYSNFAALHALGRKAKESDAQTRIAILTMVVTAMNDRSRSETQRFQCCYVISDCRDEQWVSYLVDVLFGDPSTTMRSVAAEAVANFPNSAEAQNALLQAAQQEKNQKVLDVINRRLNKGTAEYTQDLVESTSAETFLERMMNPEAGYAKFAALHALARKAKQSDANGRRSILTMVVTAMKDTSRSIYQRFQCCYVISDCGDEKWVPSLVDVLMKDTAETMRSVAAEALGKFPNNATAHDALVQAARAETNPKVLEVINRVLAKKGAGS